MAKFISPYAAEKEVFEKVKPVQPWRILFASIALLLLVVIIYFIFNSLVLPYLEEKVATKKQEIAALSRALDEEDKQEILTFYYQTQNLKQLLADHQYPSNLFQKIEDLAHKRIAITNLDFSGRNSTVLISGLAADYKSLTEQLVAFREDDFFERVRIQDLTLTGEGLMFDLELIYRSGVLKFTE